MDHSELPKRERAVYRSDPRIWRPGAGFGGGKGGKSHRDGPKAAKRPRRPDLGELLGDAIEEGEGEDEEGAPPPSQSQPSQPPAVAVSSPRGRPPSARAAARASAAATAVAVAGQQHVAAAATMMRSGGGGGGRAATAVAAAVPSPSVALPAAAPVSAPSTSARRRGRTPAAAKAKARRPLAQSEEEGEEEEGGEGEQDNSDDDDFAPADAATAEADYDDDDDDESVEEEEEEEEEGDSEEAESEEEDELLVAADGDGEEENEESAAVDAADEAGAFDDADDAAFAARIAAACWPGGEPLLSAAHRSGGVQQNPSSLSLTFADDAVFEGGLRVPSPVWSRLFAYQRTGVQWLWELHAQRVGGIVGDEMGLGKTVQVAALLAALHASSNSSSSTYFTPSSPTPLLRGPVLVVCPATVMTQWLRELRCWAPALRVVLLHSSAAASSSKVGTGRGGAAAGASSSVPAASRPSRPELLSKFSRDRGTVLVITYEGLRISGPELCRIRWGYAVLDEGHRIRTPDAATTLVAKRLMTPHRLVLTGTPIQNRLSELWSLFDFVFPGKLGTLPVFQEEFAAPIAAGGMAASTRFVFFFQSSFQFFF